MTIGVDDLEPEPDPDPVPEQLRNPAQSLPELGPLPEPDALPEFVPLDVPEFVPLEDVFVPLPEVDMAAVVASLAREADDMARFLAEYNARLDDPRELAELLAALAFQDAELLRWAQVLP